MVASKVTVKGSVGVRLLGATRPLPDTAMRNAGVRGGRQGRAGAAEERTFASGGDTDGNLLEEKDGDQLTTARCAKALGCGGL